MAGGQERVLRRRIRTVQATKKITRAMELIASSQILRAQGRIRAAGPYQDGIARVLAAAAAEAGSQAGRVVGVPEDPRRILVLTLVADRGLCGAYNTNVLRTVERMVRGAQGSQVEHRVVTVGKKAPPFLRFRGVLMERSFEGFSERPTFEDAQRVADTITRPFLAEEVDQVLVVSTRFLSAGTQVVETRQLLPLPEPTGEPEPARQGYTEFEPDPRDLLVDLVPLYAGAVVYGALLEAAASFFTAQQRAMAAATENAEELIKRLTREMNRARQDAITTEIMEIVGGAEALRHSAED